MKVLYRISKDPDNQKRKILEWVRLDLKFRKPEKSAIKVTSKMGIVSINVYNGYGERFAYPSIWASGSLSGMRNQYVSWKNAIVTKARGYYFNISQPRLDDEISLLAYCLEEQRYPELLEEEGMFCLESNYRERWAKKTEVPHIIKGDIFNAKQNHGRNHQRRINFAGR